MTQKSKTNIVQWYLALRRGICCWHKQASSKELIKPCAWRS